METLIIGKPAINVYLPLKEFPNEGDVFPIMGKNESLGNVGATAACLIAKWGMHAHFTGVVGNDAYAEKIRDVFREHHVNSKYMETQFESGTCVNYIILNSNSGYATKILYNDPKTQLSKFKYDFSPGGAIMDGTDIAGINALLNNTRSCKTILFCRNADKELLDKAKRCSYVICTQLFANAVSKVEKANSKDLYFEMYQKLVDSIGHSNIIVILDDHKILYSLNGKVKLLAEMKINVSDYSSFESVFTGAFSFAILNGLNLDDSLKLANTAAAISLSRIGEVAAIPTIDEVLDNTGLRDKLLEAKAAMDAEEAKMAAENQNNSSKKLGYGGVNPQQIADARAAEEAQSSAPEPTPAPQNQPSAFDIAPSNEQPQPAPMPEPKVETNIFDNPTNV